MPVFCHSRFLPSIYFHNLLIVGNEIRQFVSLLGFVDALLIVFDPIDTTLRHILDFVDALCILVIVKELVLGLEDGDGLAPALRMPSHKLEILAILSFQAVADVLYVLAVLRSADVPGSIAAL